MNKAEEIRPTAGMAFFSFIRLPQAHTEGRQYRCGAFSAARIVSFSGCDPHPNPE
jgi:hypothetical protein